MTTEVFLQFISKYASPLASLVGPIVGASLAALFGILIFFRQKEYELVRKRYLEDGIDEIVDQTAKALHLYQQNWTRCFLILKTYRDLKDDTPKELYSEPFPTADPNAFLSTKHFLLQQLIRDSVFYDACQMLLVFIHDAVNIFKNDLCAAIRIQIEGGRSNNIKPEQRERLIEAYLKRLNELDKEIQPYWVMLGNLQAISFVLERQRFTFKKLKNFHENETVISCTKKVRDLFGKEIAELKKMGDKPQRADAN
jgi:hypothetical protein